MPIGIIRFGGNNLKDESKLNAFINEISKKEDPLIIVVSAITEIQNIIAKAIKNSAHTSIEVELFIAQIKEIASKIKIQQNTIELISDELNELQKLLKGIQLTGDYSSYLEDLVISISEKISAKLVFELLKERGIKSKIQLPEKINLIVSDEPGNANISKEENLAIKNVKWEKINIIPGSYGINPDGKICRNGVKASDYTAAALANILNAEELELWGIDESFKTVDEQIIHNSKVIESLTYDEASEIAYFSDLTIHPRIVEPVTSKHIPILIYNLNDGKKNFETKINSESVITQNIVKSVLHDDNIAVLKLNGPGVGFKPGILAKVTTAFHEAEINIRSVITSQVSINIIINKNDLETAEEVFHSLQINSISELIILNNVSLIAVVGHGMLTHYGVSAKLFKAVYDHKINVLLSGSGASDLVSYLIIDQTDKQKAVTEIHKIFIEN